MYFIGILFALGALLGWGFGDFLIQRSTLKVGRMKVMFYIGVAGMVGLLPFVIPYFPSLFQHPKQLLIMVAAGAISFIAALAQLGAFEKGSKLSIVEPILGLELPLTVGFAIAFLAEPFGLIEGLLGLVIFSGILLAITRNHLQLHYHKRIFEKGVLLAAGAAIGQALVNLTIGVGSQEFSPLVAVWFMYSLIAIICLAYFVGKSGEHRSLVQPFKKHAGLLIIMVIINILGWLSYAYSTTRIPIALAITVSESYIALAVLLGLFIDKEKLKRHQLIGAVCAIMAVLILASIHP